MASPAGRFHLGQRVAAADGEPHRGTVRYVGAVQGQKGDWVGVEWDDVSRGKHSGEYQGRKYFECAAPGAGSLVRAAKITEGVPLTQALLNKYGLAGNAAEYKDEPLYYVRKTKALHVELKLSKREQELAAAQSAAHVHADSGNRASENSMCTSSNICRPEHGDEATLMEKEGGDVSTLPQKGGGDAATLPQIDGRDAATLSQPGGDAAAPLQEEGDAASVLPWSQAKEAHLYAEDYVSSVGPTDELAHVAHGITVLVVMNSLLSQWKDILNILDAIQTLKFLDISGARLKLDEDDAMCRLTHVTYDLATLVMSRCNVTWSQVAALVAAFPHLEHLGLMKNGIHSLRPSTAAHADPEQRGNSADSRSPPQTKGTYDTPDQNRHPAPGFALGLARKDPRNAGGTGIYSEIIVGVAEEGAFREEGAAEASFPEESAAEPSRPEKRAGEASLQVERAVDSSLGDRATEPSIPVGTALPQTRAAPDDAVLQRVCNGADMERRDRGSAPAVRAVHLDQLLPCLASLDLSANELSDWKDVMVLGLLPRLEQLNLSKNKITSICFQGGDGSTEDGSMDACRLFPCLQSLNLANNGIADWQSVSELDKLPALQKLTLSHSQLPAGEASNVHTNIEKLTLSHNPLPAGQASNVHTNIVARVGGVGTLNNSHISPQERRDCELSYVTEALADCRASSLGLDSALKIHPRLALLLQKYGMSFEEGLAEEARRSATVQRSKFAVVKLLALGAAGPAPTASKKLPISTTVRQLRTLAPQLLKLGAEWKRQEVALLLADSNDVKVTPTLLLEDLDNLASYHDVLSPLIILDLDPPANLNDGRSILAYETKVGAIVSSCSSR